MNRFRLIFIRIDGKIHNRIIFDGIRQILKSFRAINYPSIANKGRN